MPSAQHLVVEARERHPRRMARREQLVTYASAACFFLAALLLVLLLPSHRAVSVPVVIGLMAGYAITSRVRFEFGTGYLAPEQLFFVPMVLLAPLPWVPILVALPAVAAMAPDFLSRSWHPHRWIGSLADSWFSIGPVLVLAALAPGEPSAGKVGIYALAFGAQLTCDLAWSTLRGFLVDGLRPRQNLTEYAESALFDLMLTPVAFGLSLYAADRPLMLLPLGPLVALLKVLSRDRQERLGAAIELHRAYRGTVLLLADVVEHEDAYTAAHSHSVVELAHAVGGELAINEGDQDELEFAALLHDVGKIAIAGEILHKPSSLSEAEFELMRTHTIEGQLMLDRVGGLLGRVGRIVRSCHERWDGHGYPDGLAGQEIPLASRIVFCCDAYNAMTTDRPYRSALGRDEAIRELVDGAGTQFDPHVVEALIRVLGRGELAGALTDEVRAVLAARPQRPLSKTLG
jgi:hypothetical protein